MRVPQPPSDNALSIEIVEQGEISEADFETLANAEAIIFGAPTYMGSVPWQFKKFADATSKAWYNRAWKDKIFGGFTCSACLEGDKQVTLIYLQTLVSQHGGIWVSLGLPSSNTTKSTRDDVNSLGTSVGASIQLPSDAGADMIPEGDLKTAKLYGERVAAIASKLAD